MSVRAFTLIELLIVIAIIALLAALIFPAVGAIGRSSRAAKCGKQMAELAQGVVAWRAAIGKPTSVVFPAKLMDLSNSSKGGPLDGNTLVYLCPEDSTKGNDSTLGGGPFTGNFSSLHEDDCSYAYECGDAVPGSSSWADPGNKSGQDLAGKSMGQLKKVQRQFGNMDENQQYGVPFSDDYLPFVRCWYHHQWTENDTNTQRVQNAAWSTRVYWSKPFWENSANPDIPIP